MLSKIITIIPINKTDTSAADKLADEINLSIEDMQCNYALNIDGDKIYITKIKNDNKNKLSPLIIDFTSSKIAYRNNKASLGNELIAKAIGIKSNNNLHIADATAGLGGDSFLLASFGCKITMFERSPIISKLLENALERSSNILEIKETINRITLIKDNFYNYVISNNLENIDIVYLDPMFPEKNKNTAVKKEMQYLQDIVMMPNIDDEKLLFNAAYETAKYRVVVKRPKKSPYLDNQKPSHTIEGKAIRFDVYVKNKI